MLKADYATSGHKKLMVGLLAARLLCKFQPLWIWCGVVDEADAIVSCGNDFTDTLRAADSERILRATSFAENWIKYWYSSYNGDELIMISQI